MAPTMTKNYPDRHLLGVLREARAVHKQRMQPSLRAAGLTEDQWRVLRVFIQNQTARAIGLDAKRVAEESKITKSSLSGVLVRMERDGLLTRQKSVEDARFMIVKPTALGLQKARHIATLFQGYYEWLEVALGPQDMGRLYELLDKLIAISEQPAPALEAAEAAPAAAGARQRRG